MSSGTMKRTRRGRVLPLLMCLECQVERIVMIDPIANIITEFRNKGEVSHVDTLRAIIIQFWKRNCELERLVKDCVMFHKSIYIPI